MSAKKLRLTETQRSYQKSEISKGSRVYNFRIKERDAQHFRKREQKERLNKKSSFAL